MSLFSVPSPIRGMLKMNLSSRELAKLCCMDIKKISNKDIKRLDRTLISTTSLFKRAQVKRLLVKLDQCPPEHPKTVYELIGKANGGLFQRFEGTNRDVFIDNDIGVGYKLFKVNSTWAKYPRSDERLNDIYRNKYFYNGIYANYAQFGSIEMIDDRQVDKPKILVGVFKMIDGAERLAPDEKIPFSVLLNLELLGYMPFDVKPENFVKVKNSSGNYDHLPIDAKQIGLYRSDSKRTFHVEKFRRNFGAYDYKKMFVDYSR
ncbi:hypothetical protein IB289_23630 [Vibrio parahaemolyticus]|uniref:hypothetical protein n=1 Tax=Vibrio parahaemolyticus TaxID=670 RepID=UPI001A1F69FD|nr:hypothetical protein [Vibrio parahaemolyticus]MCC3859344.1 hypothetical protein [Vibrio parahaemolyticus]HAS3051484.1 hypothetical protein [Vibrio parahaemolyticus]